jgi:acetoacetyl-CoA synthetase
MTTHTTTDPPVTWRPTAEQQQHCRLAGFMQWVGQHRGIALSDYRQVWRWSVDDVSGFWDAVREYSGVIGTGFNGPALGTERMPGATWYPNAHMNFGENLLQHALTPACDTAAIRSITEDNRVRSMTWRQLHSQVASLATALRALGVQPGERVAAVLPNIPEAIVGLLATASLGAIWTINSPELSVTATLDRLDQVQPVVLIGASRYRFNGKDVDCRAQLETLPDRLPSLRHTIVVNDPDEADTASSARELLDFAALVNDDAEAAYAPVPFDHPLWILFSSGTTGKPKGIVHGHGGMTLEALKFYGLNHDVGIGDVYYVGANTSWMVWNTLAYNLMCGASVVTYAGSPTYGRADRQFDIIARTGTTIFATGAAYLSRVQSAELSPRRDWDLSQLRSIMSTGSPLPDSTWQWVHEHVKADVHLGSDSGGTEICSAFIGSNPLEPVHLGRLQGPELGVAVQAWDDSGARVIGEVGEMVITRPLPSMPVALWNDPDGARYSAAYFERFPGVWTHGDWITETPEGEFIVHGRSDATLNRGGVRLGSSDIYAALEPVAEVLDALVVGAEEPDGGYYMPLFVVLAHDAELTDELATRINAIIREQTSPRHVPDEIIAAPAVPMTHTLKKAEVPVKKLFAGHDPSSAIAKGSLTNPDSIDFYVEQARRRRSTRAAAASDQQDRSSPSTTAPGDTRGLRRD